MHSGQQEQAGIGTILLQPRHTPAILETSSLQKSQPPPLIGQHQAFQRLLKARGYKADELPGLEQSCEGFDRPSPGDLCTLSPSPALQVTVCASPCPARPSRRRASEPEAGCTQLICDFRDSTDGQARPRLSRLQAPAREGRPRGSGNASTSPAGAQAGPAVPAQTSGHRTAPVPDPSERSSTPPDRSGPQRELAPGQRFLL